MAIKRLRKHGVVQAASFPAVVDIVVYQDEEGVFYTLKAILDSKPKSLVEDFAIAICMDKFAPEHITGEAEFAANEHLVIRMDGVLYEFAYGLPEFLAH